MTNKHNAFYYIDNLSFEKGAANNYRGSCWFCSNCSNSGMIGKLNKNKLVVVVVKTTAVAAVASFILRL